MNDAMQGEECSMYVIMRQVRMALTHRRNGKLLMQVSFTYVLRTSVCIFTWKFNHRNTGRGSGNDPALPAE